MMETGLDGKSKTCVIISYWVSRPAKDLNRLLAQMQKIDACAPFDVLIVCNGGLERPLSSPSLLWPSTADSEPREYRLQSRGLGSRVGGMPTATRIICSSR